MISIDAMRGAVIIVMLFLNDLPIPEAPFWFNSRVTQMSGNGIIDFILPLLLFITGLVIPYSIDKRLSESNDNITVSKHIIKRTISLLIIGVLMINPSRVNPELTIIGKTPWAILMFAGIFLLWNDYREKENNFFSILRLKLVGLCILLTLVLIFRSGEPVNDGSIITGWWGVTGIIGWGYLLSALIYLVTRNKILKTLIALIFFLALGMFTGLNKLPFLNPVRNITGVVINGNVPALVIAGISTTLIIRKLSEKNRNTINALISISGILCIITGWFLRKWFISMKADPTMSWSLICTGTGMILYILFRMVEEIKNHNRSLSVLKSTGENSLTIFLIGSLLYYLMWGIKIPVFFYKQSTNPLIYIAGSIIWTILVLLISKAVIKFKIRVKI